MNLNYFETFIQVARLKSFSRAAETLKLTQPAVSFQIHALEKAYQEVFFDRTGQKIELTEAGRIFLSYVEEILRVHQQMIDALSELRNVVRGTLALVASNIPGEYLLPRLMGEFKAKYPDVQLKLQICDTREVVARLIAHEADLGFCGATIEKAPLIFEEFAIDEIVIACSPVDSFANKEMITARELLKRPLIMREHGSGTRHVFLTALAEKGIEEKDLNIVLELGSTQSVISAVSSGVGVSPISYLALIDHLDAGSIRYTRIKDLDLRRPLYIVYNEKSPFSKAQQAFLDFVRDRRHALMRLIPV